MVIIFQFAITLDIYYVDETGLLWIELYGKGDRNCFFWKTAFNADPPWNSLGYSEQNREFWVSKSDTKNESVIWSKCKRPNWILKYVQ